MADRKARLRKAIVSFLLLFALIVTLSGCGTPETSSIVTAPQAKAPTADPNPSGPKPTDTGVSAQGGGKLAVHFIDVGQADSILVTCGGDSLLIDAGNNADADTVVGYLKAQGIIDLDYVIGTHPHEDHIGSLDAVIRDFDIGKIIMPEVTNNTRTFEDVLAAIRDRNLTITKPVPGTDYDLGAAKFSILAPNNTNYDDLNDWSVAVKLVFGDNSFLFMGDAGNVSEKEILNKGYDVAADVIKIGHHGSSTATSVSFLNAVNPKYAVISVGKDNDYGHPHLETMDLLKEKNIPVYRTDECGTVVAASDGKTITWNVQPGSYKDGATRVSSGSATGNPTAPVVVVPPATTGSGRDDPTVYITKTGERYHVDGCSSLRKSKIPLRLSEAKAQGYTPCGNCHPPR